MAEAPPAVDPDAEAKAALEALRASNKKQAPTQTPVQTQTVPDADPDAEAKAALAALRAKNPPAGGGTAPPVDNSWGTIARGAPNQIYQGALEGGAGLLGLPAIAEHGIGTLLGKAGINIPDNVFTRFLTPETSTQMLEGAQKNLGYDPTQPTDLPNQLLRGVGQATATLPLGEAMGMTRAANAAYTYIPSVVGDLAHHYLNNINPLWASLPTALTMAGAERYLAEGGAKWTAEKAAQKAAEDAAAAQAAREAHEAGNPAFTRGLQEHEDISQAEAYRGKMFSEADAAKRHESEHTSADLQLQNEHAGADADREAVADSLGQSQTVQKGGEALQNAARTWKKVEFPDQLKKAEEKMYYGAVNIPEDALGNLNGFESSLKNSFYKAGELEPIAQRLRSRMPEGLQNAIDQIRKERNLGPDNPLVGTLDDMRKLRSILGDAMTDKSLVSGVDAGKMNEAYRGLSDDMEKAIEKAAGPQGVAQFKRFNEKARRLYGLASGPVSDIISTTDKAGETIAPGDAVTSVLKGSDKDATRLEQLASEPTLKKGLNEVASAQLRTGKGAGVVQGDPDKFFTGLAPESKTALLGDDNAGKLQNAIDRRTAAESQATKTKAGADKDLADMQAAAARQSTVSLKAGGAVRQDMREGRSETGIGLKQEEAARDAALEEAKAKLKALKTPPPASWNNFPWLKTAIGFGGLTEGPHMLSPLADTLPDWQHKAAALGLGGAGWLAAKGGKELLTNPTARKAVVQAGMSTVPPNALGWSVEKNQ
jgi:hypothetical protein